MPGEPFMCLAEVADMITGSEAGAFEIFMKERGGQAPPYRLGDLAQFLLWHDLSLGFGLVARSGRPLDLAGDQVSVALPLKGQPACVIVRMGEAFHALYWDGHRITDPSSPLGKVGERPLNAYDLYAFWPVLPLHIKANIL